MDGGWEAEVGEEKEEVREIESRWYFGEREGSRGSSHGAGQHRGTPGLGGIIGFISVHSPPSLCFIHEQAFAAIKRVIGAALQASPTAATEAATGKRNEETGGEGGGGEGGGGGREEEVTCPGK